MRNRAESLLHEKQKEISDLRTQLQETTRDFEHLGVSTQARLDIAAAEIASMEKQIAQGRVELMKREHALLELQQELRESHETIVQHEAVGQRTEMEMQALRSTSTNSLDAGLTPR